MGDEWVCKECGNITNDDPGDKTCPGCGTEMINISDVDENLQPKKTTDNYEDERSDNPEIGLDEIDFVPELPEEY